MMDRFFALAAVVVLGMCGACSRSGTTAPDRAGTATPEPITANAVEPPKPVPVQLGEPPRLKEEPR
jgi:hypothetical protein